MIILLGCYHVLLSREQMHRFNRYFLLVSLIFSLAVPFTTFEVTVPAPTRITLEQSQDIPLEALTAAEDNLVATQAYSFEKVLLYIYLSIALLFAIRFAINLFRMVKRTWKNPIERWQQASLVLLQEKVLPHSFLRYIFLEKEAFQHKKIAPVLLQHELEHVKQKHSLDIVFVELLQIVFWFNPLLFLYKKAIKLNHEFLADASVIQSNNDINTYQHLLLGTAGGDTENYLASSINYSVTKKRLQMMTKQTKGITRWAKSLLLLPLFAFLLYSFSERKAVYEDLVIDEHLSVQDIYITAKANDLIVVNDQYDTNIDELKNVLSTFNADMSKEARANNVRAYIEAEPNVRMGFIIDIEEVLIDYGVKRFELGEDLNVAQDPKLKERIERYRAQAKVYGKEIQEYLKNPTSVKHNSLMRSLENALKLYEGFSKVEKKTHSILPPPPPPATKIQEGATKAQIEEYNALASKYNNMPKDKMKVMRKEVLRMEYLYSVMTEAQRKKAEAFPEFPPMPKPPTVIEVKEVPRPTKIEVREVPPPPPPLPKNPTPAQVKRHKEALLYYEKSLAKAKKLTTAPPPPPPPLPKNPTPAQVKKHKEAQAYYEKAVKLAKSPTAPPPPPPPLPDDPTPAQVKRYKEAQAYYEKAVATYKKQAISAKTKAKVWEVQSAPKRSVSEKERAEYYKNATFKLETIPGKYVQTNYQDLPEEHKARLVFIPKKPKMNAPSQSQLDNWKSGPFGVWIDDKQIKKSELAQYSPSSFAYYFASRLHKNAKNYGKYKQEIHLYTPAHYKKNYGKGSDFGKPLSKSTVIFIKKDNSIHIKN